jgi:hypothetical protein
MNGMKKSILDLFWLFANEVFSDDEVFRCAFLCGMYKGRKATWKKGREGGSV